MKQFGLLLCFWLINTITVQAQTADEFIAAAIDRTRHQVTYNGAYFKIDYPNGDIPSRYGVCTDVVIRTYRVIGVDLQRLVHEDIRTHFSEYPAKRIWNQTAPDRNIDHRRVPNLQTFFSRHGQKLPISLEGKDYQPGDLVTWILPGNLPHIGIVINQQSTDGKRPLIVHNIGAGPTVEDVLFNYDITGHYRYKI